MSTTRRRSYTKPSRRVSGPPTDGGFRDALTYEEAVRAARSIRLRTLQERRDAHETMGVRTVTLPKLKFLSQEKEKTND